MKNTKNMQNQIYLLDELQAIHNLKTDNDLIVKPADKGGAIVIWPKDAYLAEAYRQ